MKKTLSIMLMLLLVAAMLPMALAQDETTDQSSDHIKIEVKIEGDTSRVKVETNDQEESFSLETTDLEEVITEIMSRTDLTRDQIDANINVERDDEVVNNEVDEMNTIPGAKVRLLQLERAITRNILRGKEVIKHTDNTTELESILSEMEVLKEEVQNTDPSATDAVKRYVELRQDASDLTKKFRDAARTQLKDKADEVRSGLKDVDETELEDLDTRIAKERRAFNSERMRLLADILGITDSDTLAKIDSGDLTAQEALDILMNRLKEMTTQERLDAFARVREEKVKARVDARTKAEEARKEALQERESRIKERLAELEKRGEDVEKYRDERLQAQEANTDDSRKDDTTEDNKTDSTTSDDKTDDNMSEDSSRY